jgi:chemotaxis protein histidine kinase CheA
LSALADQLQQITTAIDDLRAHPVDGPETRQLLDTLFRRVHSLKAAAAADGLNDLSRAANEVENLLHSLRTGSASLNDQTLQRLTDLAQNLPTDLIPTEILNSLKAEEKHALAQSLKEGADLFLIQTSFDVADFDQKFQELRAQLTTMGEVISVAPQFDHKGVNFRILYATTTSELNNPGVTITELSRQHATLDHVLKRAIQAGQAVAVALEKEVDFEVRGADLSLDPELCKAIANPLLHLVRNAIDHGIEEPEERVKQGKPSRGRIVIEVRTNDDQTNIKISDDGRGIDSENVDVIFDPGFSTASQVTDVSGRGVGLDAVRAEIEATGGSVNVINKPGHGTTFEITFPKEVSPAKAQGRKENF